MGQSLQLEHVKAHSSSAPKRIARLDLNPRWMFPTGVCYFLLPFLDENLRLLLDLVRDAWD